MFIKLTNINGAILRVNINHIEGYLEPIRDNKLTQVNMHNEDLFEVTETPEQIDQLIKATPTHPTVTSLGDLVD